MKFKTIDNVVLFGGSRILADFVVFAKKHLPFRLTVFTSKRHLGEIVPGSRKTLQQILKANRVTVYESADINHDKRLKQFVNPATLGMAFGAVWIFEKKTVKLFRPGHLLDFMGIDLPRYRGGAHYTWQILHGNRQGAANLQIIRGGKESFHRGEIIKRQEFVLPQRAMRPIDYFDFMAGKELELLKEFFRDIKLNKTFKLVRLEESQSSYYPFLSTQAQGYINWGWTGEQICRFINAFDEPYAGAATYLENERVYLKGCRYRKPQEDYHPFTSGVVVRKDKSAIYIASVGGLLEISEVLNEKGKNVRESIELGSRFYTSHGKLDEGMGFRAVYNAGGLKK